MDVQSSEVGPGSAAVILMLYPHRVARPARPCGMFPPTGLDAGLFVCGNDELIVFQWLILPLAGIQIKQSPGVLGGFGISRENATAEGPTWDCLPVGPPPPNRSPSGVNPFSVIQPPPPN